MSRRRAATAAAAALVVVLAWLRAAGPDLRRPLQYDELCTIEYYTWAGLAPDGTSRPLRRAADLGGLSRPSGLQVAMGLYRALGVWREPNNHVWNSALVNLALVVKRSAAAARVPAFLGALAFAALLWLVCGPVLGWRRAAPLVAVWGFAAPYVVAYGVAARGYTWMLALEVAFVGAAVAAARRPESIARAALVVGIGVAAFANVVSLALDWAIPVYLALALAPPIAVAVDAGPWRRSLVVQLLAFAAIAAVFFVDRLPYLVSGLRLYGDPLSAAPASLDALFPTLAWKAIALLGVAGTLALLATPRARWLGLAGVLVVGATAGHALVAGRLPYARTLGFLLAPTLLGAAFAVDEAFRRTRGVAAVLVFAGAAALTVAVVADSLSVHADADPRVPALAALTGATSSGSRPDRAVLPHTSDYHLDKFLPAGWLDDGDALVPGTALTLRVLLELRDGWGFEMQRARSLESVWRPVDCGPLACSAPVDRWRFASLAGVVEPFPVADVPSGETLVVWYPASERLGLDSHALLDFVDAAGVPYVRRNVREPVKLDYVGRLRALEFWSGSGDEWRRLVPLVTAGLARFGGRAVVVAPHST